MDLKPSFVSLLFTKGKQSETIRNHDFKIFDKAAPFGPSMQGKQKSCFARVWWPMLLKPSV